MSRTADSWEGRETDSPTLSLCMIVKNEEKFLPQCLESVKDVVDEMVIVDTGSTDRTVEIAKGFGAKVYHHPWQNSFSEARNYGLQFATGDWILHLDADERFEHEDVPLLRRLIRSDQYNGIVVAIYSLLDGEVSKFYYERIFRRGKAHYEGIVHNQLILEGKRVPSEIRLYHYGYNLSREEMQAKWDRTTELLKIQVARNPDDKFARFNLVRNYRTQGLFDLGIAEGEKAFEQLYGKEGDPGTSPNPGIYLMIVYEVANCLLRKEEYEKAEKLCLSALGGDDGHPDLLFTLGSVYLKDGRYREAIRMFHRFLDARAEYMGNLQEGSLLVDTLGYDYAAYNGLGFCYQKIGDWKRAVENFRRSIEANPRYVTARRNLAICWKEQGKFDRSGDVYYVLGDYQKAIEYYERYLISEPDAPHVLIMIADSYAKQNNWESALLGFRAALEVDPRSIVAKKGVEVMQSILSRK